jgi:aryl-alcohol dehydrogenase-like predicted oxidoreductase
MGGLVEGVQIGSSSLRIARIVLGGNVFGWTVNQRSSFELLDAFVDRGFNCIDTADVYARFAPGCQGGESESVIGNWLAQGGCRRQRIVLCTKVGVEMAPGEKGLSEQYIERAVEASLRRLRTDYIDLYYSHRDDPATPLAQTLGVYDRLIRAGKVRAIGASNYCAERLAEALEVSRDAALPQYACLQPLYNLYDRGTFEGGLQQLCVARELSVMPYCALASGFLSGKYRAEADFEGRDRSFLTRRYLDARGLRILAAMDLIAAERQVSLVQIALAWLLSRPGVTAPIASATSLVQLEDVLTAVQVQLSSQELAQLETASGADLALQV